MQGALGRAGVNPLNKRNAAVAALYGLPFGLCSLERLRRCSLLQGTYLAVSLRLASISRLRNAILVRYVNRP